MFSCTMLYTAALVAANDLPLHAPSLHWKAPSFACTFAPVTVKHHPTFRRSTAAGTRDLFSGRSRPALGPLLWMRGRATDFSSTSRAAQPYKPICTRKVAPCPFTPTIHRADHIHSASAFQSRNLKAEAERQLRAPACIDDPQHSSPRRANDRGGGNGESPKVRGRPGPGRRRSFLLARNAMPEDDAPPRTRRRGVFNTPSRVRTGPRAGSAEPTHGRLDPHVRRTRRGARALSAGPMTSLKLTEGASGNASIALGCGLCCWMRGRASACTRCVAGDEHFPTSLGTLALEIPDCVG